jgi:hypothetical protein
MAMASDRADDHQTYLNDHLAGAHGALELLEDIEASDDPEMTELAQQLRAEITADREQLELVMDRLDVSRERAKQLLASLAESMSRLKLARAGATPELARLLELESLSAGIWMKKRLWRSLTVAEHVGDRLVDIDLDELQARADRQLDRVEEHRLALAARAL